MFVVPCLLVLLPIFHYHTHSYPTSLIHVSSNVRNIFSSKFSDVIIYQSPSIGVDGFDYYPSPNFKNLC
jgi:hypothetical protein